MSTQQTQTAIHLGADDLLDYTDWERGKWHGWFRKHGPAALAVSVGPHGDGRFATVGDLVRHVFSAEKRYVERLSDKPLTDTATIPADDVDALFEFGSRSRRALRDFIATFPAEKWDAELDMTIGVHSLQVSPRKVVVHVVIHEIRHWTQIATLLRVQGGLTGEPRDFLLSPVLPSEDARQLIKPTLGSPEHA